MSVNNDVTRTVVSWRVMDQEALGKKAAEMFKKMQAERGIQTIDPSKIQPMSDMLEIRHVNQTANTYGPGKTPPSAKSEESADASMEIKVDLENKQVQMGQVKIPNIQGIGYKINDDWSLTPFIDCLPADDPNSALAFFEKSVLGKNTSDPYSSIMKYLNDRLPSIQETVFPNNVVTG